MNNKKFANIFKGDKVIWMVFFFLCIISVIEVFSASSELTYKDGSFMAPMLKHIGILLLGFICMVITLNIKCRYFKILTPFLIPISILTLIWVLFGGQVNGASRWISFLGIQFQPSEIAKGTLVLATAQILSAMQTENGADKQAFKYILFISALIILPILVENLSTALLLSFVILLMMIVGRVPVSQWGRLLGIGAIFVVCVFAAVMLLGKNTTVQNPSRNMTEQIAQVKTQKSTSPKLLHRFDTWKSRIDKFLNDSVVPPNEVDLDADGQRAHAYIAIASSNIVGKGPGNSVERDFLSQAFSDFIYAIIIEEMGIEGAFFVALLYIILLFRTGRIANRCENNFPAYLAMGLAFLLVTQALFNMCVAVGIAPVTGQPLPLISKGGTSTIINCIYVGAILSISRSAKKKDASADEQEENTSVAVAE